MKKKYKLYGFNFLPVMYAMYGKKYGAHLVYEGMWEHYLPSIQGLQEYTYILADDGPRRSSNEKWFVMPRQLVHMLDIPPHLTSEFEP